MTELAYRQQQVLYDKKWQTLLGRARLFRHIPFIDAAFGSGSLALGNVTADSDLDVLLAARGGRIFTARAAAIAAFGLFGWRRSKLDHRSSAADKVCLNHFITPTTYALTLEPNDYWKLLYRQLTPVYGSSKIITAFFRANESWAGKIRFHADSRHRYDRPSWLKRALERLLAGRFGDWLETKLKQYQVRRIERGLPAPDTARPSVIRAVLRKYGTTATKQFELPPLITYTDAELQFHPDPAIIELY